jgi:dipeptidyl aminopeptidase/acylaminoacyl peptidase
MGFIRLSPLYGIDGSEPPFLLIHGREDLIVDSAEPEVFLALLQAAGVDARLLMLSDAGHRDISDAHSAAFEESCQAMEAFFGEVLE